MRTAVLALMFMGQPSHTTLAPVLKAELAFAQMADEKGIQAAFVHWFSEDGTVLTPTPANGRTFYGTQPVDPGHLSWYPQAMGLATSGDLAWSHGPWEYRAKKTDEKPLVQGHFLSIWRRQSTGEWKVEADAGTPHSPDPQRAQIFAASESLALSAPDRTDPMAAEASLRLAEKELSDLTAREGGMALIPALAKGAKLMRLGTQPQDDPAGIRRTLAGEASTRWELAQARTSEGGDLGWTAGLTSKTPEGRSFSFLRVWIREGGAWRVRFDLRLPMPEGAPPK